MTVKTRITLWIVGAGFVASLLFSVIIFLELIEQPFRILDTLLEEEAHWVTRVIIERQGGSDSALPDSALQTLVHYWIGIYDQDAGHMVFRSNLAKAVALPPVQPGDSEIARVVIPGSESQPNQNRGRATPFRIRTFSIGADGRSFIVQIGRPMEKLDEEIWELVFGIVAGLIFSTLILVVISRYVAGKILRPIGRMKDLARDISGRNLEQRLQAGEGWDEFSQLARTINGMLDRLQYSFARQRNFLFDTSHELKTPLTTIRLAVDQIVDSESTLLSPSAQDNLQRLKEQALRVERLVKDLLNLSALETLAAIDPKPVPISRLLSSLADEYGYLADASHITMEVHIPEGLVIDGDGEKLYRIFSNLLDNAVKYNVEGGRIALAAQERGAELAVSIGNTGPGVGEAEIPRVFDQFYRAEKSRSHRHGGTGLGLTIVKRIIELHAGKVEFESRPDDWTWVTVSLPVNPKKTSA